MSLKLNCKLSLMASAVLLCAASSAFAASQTASWTAATWTVSWLGNGWAKAMPAEFDQKNPHGEYKTHWSGNPPVDGTMLITETKNSFQGRTESQSNGDVCSIFGVITRTSAHVAGATGQFSCTQGSQGQITATIND